MVDRKIDAVIFDLDGTLLDTIDDLADSCNMALRENGLKEHSRDEIQSFVGNGIGVLMEKAVPGGKENPLFANVLLSMKKAYSMHWRNKTRPYDGVMDLLDSLKKGNVKVGIVSNKPDRQVKELAELFFSGYMDIGCALGEMESLGIKRKPAPDSVLRVLEILKTKKENAIYVGDSDVDILTARNAGMDCLSVCWGFKTKDFLMEHGARVLVDHPMDILKLI